MYSCYKLVLYVYMYGIHLWYDSIIPCYVTVSLCYGLHFIMLAVSSHCCMLVCVTWLCIQVCVVPCCAIWRVSVGNVSVIQHLCVENLSGQKLWFVLCSSIRFAASRWKVSLVWLRCGAGVRVWTCWCSKVSRADFPTPPLLAKWTVN